MRPKQRNGVPSNPLIRSNLKDVSAVKVHRENKDDEGSKNTKNTHGETVNTNEQPTHGQLF
jgi:hypothetical protein